MKPRILTVGTVDTELLLYTDRAPEAGECGRADKYVYLPGGSATETAVAVSRLEGESLVCAKVGDDPNAHDLKDYLSSEKIDTRFVTVQRGENSAMTVRLCEQGSGERKMISDGASAFLSSEDIEDAYISYPDAVILHGDVPASAIEKTVMLSSDSKHQTPIFIMSGGFPSSFPLERIEKCEVLSLNDRDTLKCTGIDPVDQERCMKACLALMQKVSAKHIILRLGDRGYFLYDGMYYDFISAYDVVIPNGIRHDRAFAAALTLEYMRSDRNIKRSCEYAAIVCAIYLTRGGGLRAYPVTEDVRRFIERNDIEFEL